MKVKILFNESMTVFCHIVNAIFPPYVLFVFLIFKALGDDKIV